MAFSSCIWLTIRLSRQAMPRTSAKPPKEWLSPSNSKQESAHRTLGDCKGHDVHIYQWMAPGGHHRGVQSKPNAAMILYRHLRLTFFFYELLNRNQRNFFCTYFCNKQNCPIKVNKEICKSMKITTKKKEARQKKKKNTVRHTVFKQISWDIFWKQILKKGLRQEWKENASVAAASFDNSRGNLKVEDCL